MERTLILIKPDAVARGLTGDILTRIERKGFTIIGQKLLAMNQALAAKLYKPHYGKPFYPPLVAYMTSGPIVALCLEGAQVIDQMRNLMGATNPAQAAPGTFRGDYALRIEHNIVHGSDSAASARREIPIFFKASELVKRTLPIAKWL